MQKLGSGYFYDVFDLGNGRVEKRERTLEETARSIKGNTDMDVDTSLAKARKSIEESAQNTKIIIEKLAYMPGEFLGSPIFHGLSYEQDKVILLMDYWENHTFEENKLVSDKYFKLTEGLLEYGIHDHVYKFKNSYGLNNKDEVVFIDFNEIVSSKEEAIILIKEREWEKQAQFRKYPEGEFKEYLRTKFEDLMREEKINELWGRSLPTA